MTAETTTTPQGVTDEQVLEALRHVFDSPMSYEAMERSRIDNHCDTRGSELAVFIAVHALHLRIRTDPPDPAQLAVLLRAMGLEVVHGNVWMAGQLTWDENVWWVGTGRRVKWTAPNAIAAFLSIACGLALVGEAKPCEP